MEQQDTLWFLQCKIDFENFKKNEVYKIVQKLEDHWIVADNSNRKFKLEFSTIRQKFLPIGHQ